MFSLGTLKPFAFSTALASVMFPSTLPPPSRAATSTARRSFAYMFDRLASVASFLRLIVAHLEWPDIALHLPQHVVVEPGLTHELRVEGCHKDVAVLQDDGPILESGEHLDGVADPFDPGGADEDPAEGVLDAAHVEVGFEGIDLAAVGVAAHVDVQKSEQGLATVDLAREHDHARAGAEDRHACGRSLPNRLDEVVGARELADRRGFPAGDGEAIDLGELFGCSHLHGRRPERGEHLGVLTEVALQGEHTSLHAALPAAVLQARLERADLQPVH